MGRHEDLSMLSPRFFVVFVLAATLLVSVATVAANVAIDFYGLFGPVRGRHIVMHFNERFEKNLLSRKYVPENFDALLIGPSTSFNIDTRNWTSYKIYNMSILAGTITELKALVDNYLSVRTPRLVIIGMYPYMLKAHGMKTEYISDRALYGVLGSMDILKTYILSWYHESTGTGTYNEYGYHEYEEVPVEKAEDAIREKASDPGYRQELAIDSLAWMEYRELIEELERRGARIVQYYHPIPRPVYEAHREFFDTYYEWTRRLLPETAVSINFNALEFHDFTSKIDHYQDDCHLSGKGAQKLGEIIYRSLLDNVEPQSLAPNPEQSQDE